jgi:LssY C-terminus
MRLDVCLRTRTFDVSIPQKRGIFMMTTKSSLQTSLLLMSTLFAGIAAAANQQPANNPPGQIESQTAPATSSPAVSSDTATTTKNSYSIKVDASKEWVDTQIDVRGGAKLKFTATGNITYSGKNTRTFGPEGLTRGYADLIHQYAVPNGAHGELIGRLGSGGTAEAFEIGTGTTYVAPVAERLFVGINQSMRDASTATGTFEVKIDVLEQGTITTVGGPVEAAIPELSAKVVDSIPRRVSDQQHNPGDMVNVLLIGSEEEVVKVFTTAGWVKVDKSVQNTLVEGLMDTLEKKDYLTMPMSVLYLFDRPQDYGFAHAEPVRVVMSRNHLRVWKSPYEVNGRPLWCVAATHDIGFERDQRNNGLTHKIDPAIDGEREYVNQTLSGTGLVIARTHVTPASPLTTAKTATGGEFHSDGRILVLKLKQAELTEEKPD